MPLCKPKKGEKQKDFINRCMSDDVMKSEFGNNDQRLAVCYQQWKDKDKKDLDMDIERRLSHKTEIRAVDDPQTKSKKLEGYAARFNVISEDLGGFREQIAPGAFKKSIKADDIRALMNHDANYVLGRSSADTLKLKEDDDGLKVIITPPDTQWARDLVVSIERGDIDQMSFGFRVITDSWEKKDSENLRTLQEVNLIDVSPVTFPAYPQTSIHTRSLFQKDVMDRIFIRYEHKLELDESDYAEIRKMIGLLQTLEAPKKNLEEARKKEEEILLATATFRKHKLNLRNRTFGR